MDETLNAIGTVGWIGDHSIKVQFEYPVSDFWWYPWFCLQKLDTDLTCESADELNTVTIDGIDYEVDSECLDSLKCVLDDYGYLDSDDDDDYDSDCDEDY